MTSTAAERRPSRSGNVDILPAARLDLARDRVDDRPSRSEMYIVKSPALRTSIPGPRRVILMNLDQPWPVLVGDQRYHAAMVIGLINGVPCGSVEIDLGDTADRINARLKTLVEIADHDELLGAGRRNDSIDRNSPDDVELPGISVVIPTVVRRVDDLRLLLEGLTAASYPGVEILLVDNRPTLPKADPLPALVAAHSDVRVIRARQPGISAARNAGIHAARHDIVAFTDDDVRVDAGWLRAVARRFTDDPTLDAVTGLILPAELETPAQIWFERYYGGFGGRRNFAPVTVRAEDHSGRLRYARATVRDDQGREVRRLPIYGIGGYGAGANMAFRRSSLHNLGLFDTALGTGTRARGGEDLAMLVAILWSGGTIGYEPAAVVHHRHRREWPELLHQLQGNGLGFTAMLTSAVLSDRRHLLALAAQVPVAVRGLTAQSAAKLSGKAPERASDVDDSYPRQMVLNELLGYPLGPFAYLRSRRSDRLHSGGSLFGERNSRTPTAARF